MALLKQNQAQNHIPARISHAALFQGRRHYPFVTYNMLFTFSAFQALSLWYFRKKKYYSLLFSFSIGSLKEAIILIVGYLWFHGEPLYSDS